MSKNHPSDVDLPAALASPARRALAAAGISRLEQLTQISQAELAKLHGMGPKAIQTLSEALYSRGLDFASPDESIHISDQVNRNLPQRSSNSSS